MDSKTETVSDNETIARFMGHQYDKKEFGVSRVLFKNLWLPPKYSTSWDWLMPVVEKVLDTEFCGKFEEWKNLVNKIHNAMIRVSIAEVHKAVVKFIRWYNGNK